MSPVKVEGLNLHKKLLLQQASLQRAQILWLGFPHRNINSLEEALQDPLDKNLQMWMKTPTKGKITPNSFYLAQISHQKRAS